MRLNLNQKLAIVAGLVILLCAVTGFLFAIMLGLVEAAARETAAGGGDPQAVVAQVSERAGGVRLALLGLVGLSSLSGLGLALLILRVVMAGVASSQQTLASLADRCATQLAEGLERLRDGDLTFPVVPSTARIEHIPDDALGRTAAKVNELRDRIVAAIDAYNEARAGLAGTITEVQGAADGVSRASGQLNAAASQTGAATQQVAQTIGQVAGGTAEQARAASDANAAVMELSSVIGQVGDGAKQASASVERSIGAIDRMRAALAQTDQARTRLAPANEAAAAAATRVAEALTESSAGMARIKTAVDESAVRVAELGAKGEQIGAIVETIDDIAEQTNLLALNAAIEAARAGEMGKGFAVVADEVRRLAERSGRATKEIASLIRQVQQGTSDAVAAMTAGAAEVEQGLVIGRRSSESVAEIRGATAVRDAGVADLYAAVDEIASAALEVSRSADDIARVVALTASSATQMDARAKAVTHGIGSIAAVSEENSAAAQEVSAATEEMSAQAEEVVASASTLADMAAQLDALVARFALERGPATSPARPEAGRSVVAQRRAGDRRRAA